MANPKNLTALHALRAASDEIYDGRLAVELARMALAAHRPTLAQRLTLVNLELTRLLTECGDEADRLVMAELADLRDPPPLGETRA